MSASYLIGMASIGPGMKTTIATAPARNAVTIRHTLGQEDDDEGLAGSGGRLVL